MQAVHNYIRVTVPASLVAAGNTSLGAALLRSALAEATKAAGGATATCAQGTWYNGDAVVTERVYQYQWNCSEGKLLAVRAAVERVIDALFECGEVSVMRERYYVSEFPLGYRAGIIFAPTKH